MNSSLSQVSTNHKRALNYLYTVAVMVGFASLTLTHLLLQGISLNVFKGFQTEEEIIDYALNKAYFDNVTVLAGTDNFSPTSTGS